MDKNLNNIIFNYTAKANLRCCFFVSCFVIDFLEWFVEINIIAYILKDRLKMISVKNFVEKRWAGIQGGSKLRAAFDPW